MAGRILHAIFLHSSTEEMTTRHHHHHHHYRRHSRIVLIIVIIIIVVVIIVMWLEPNMLCATWRLLLLWTLLVSAVDHRVLFSLHGLRYKL